MRVETSFGGIRRIRTGYSRAVNFLGGDGIREGLKTAGKLYGLGVVERIATFTPGPVPDLSPRYKKAKLAATGEAYPILVRSGFTISSINTRVVKTGDGRWTIQLLFRGQHPTGPSTADLMRWHGNGTSRGLPARDWSQVSERIRAAARNVFVTRARRGGET